MAATNHDKENKTPTWAQRGKMRLLRVPGGPLETARMLLASEWKHTPAELLPALRYGAELVDTLLERHATAVCLTWSRGFSHESEDAQWALIKRLLPALKKKKVRAIAEISIGCAVDELLQRVPQARGWIKKPYGLGSDESHSQILEMDLWQAGWREYLWQKVRAALDCGIDGLHFIDDGLQKSADPCEFSAATDSLLKELRQSIATNYPDKEILFSSEDALLEPPNFVMASLPPSETDSSGALRSNLPRLKFASEVRGRERTHSFVCREGTAPGVAEILAAGATCHDFDAPAALHRFQAEHPALFGAMDPVNSIGVLDDRNMGIGTSVPPLLARRNIQFDIIPLCRIKHFDLRKYKLISAYELGSVPGLLGDVLLNFVREQKGTVLLNSAVPWETGFPMTLPAEPELRIESKTGQGQFIVYSPSSPESWDAVSALILEDARKFGGEPAIEVEAPDGIVALLWGKGTRRTVHVLNYGPKPCDATITLPGCGGRKVHIFSPDDKVSAMEVLETGSAVARFALRGLQTYAIVEVL